MSPFEVDHSEITVSRSALLDRMAELRRWGWQAESYQVLDDLLDGLPSSISAEELEDGLEAVAAMIPHLTCARWGIVCEVLLPETFADPRNGKKVSDSIPGSRSRLWRLSERARTGISLHHPRDSHGVPDPVQTTLF